MLIYGFALAAFPLITFYSRRHVSLGELLPATPLPGLLLGSMALLLVAAYLFGYRVLRRAAPTNGAIAVVLLFPLIFTLLLFWVQPVTSVDIYDYLFRGRILAHYGANPFVATPEQVATDRLVDYVGWRKAATAYGPLWELLSGMAAALAGDNLLRLVLSYKLLALVSYALCAWVIWWNWDRRTATQRLRGLYLWLWNPLVLWELVANGHNDGWLALSILIAALALMAGRYRLGLFALVAGALVKFTPLLLLPVALAYAFRQKRLVRATQGLALGLLLGAIAYAHFWAGQSTFDNILNRQPLWFGSPLALARLAAAQWSGVAVNPWDVWPGGWLTLLLLGLVVAVATTAAYRRPFTPPLLLAAALWLILYLANPWFQPWYLVWLIAPAVCLPDNRALQQSTMLFAATALLSYLPGLFLLPQLGWAGDGLAWQALYVALIYLPPLLLLSAGLRAAVSFRSAQRSSARRSIARLGPLPFE